MDSNTADNSRKASGKPFVKGDKRINRNGRPKSFDALRELAQGISHEVVEVRAAGGEVMTLTVAEAILRQWANSKNPQLQRAFIEIAFGKAPDNLQVDVTSKGKSIVVDWDTIAEGGNDDAT